ncbi:hypothetical protein Tco_0803441 [Tanacetum coccineum]|uniref:Uncharacterized protein n=1 Tax=Tanacetum coccineum TaxID=301880 RepID=A0ABQ5A5Y6_9ASTR
MENFIALNHKLDELIKSLKSLPKETNEEDLAAHEYREQQDLGTPMEVKPFNQTQLDDLALNTCIHDLFISFREVHSVDESETQPLPNFLSLDVNLGDKRGTDSPINLYSPGSFRVKENLDANVISHKILYSNTEHGEGAKMSRHSDDVMDCT